MDPADERDLHVLREVRRNTKAAILVAAPGDRAEGFVDALAAGAAACVHESDGAAVIAAQAAAIGRARSDASRQETSTTLRVGDLVIDLERRQVTSAGAVVPLAPVEFKILARLAENPGRVLSPTEIMAAVHEYSYLEAEARNVVKVYVRRIRQKLNVASEGDDRPERIVNARGFGYMLEPRVEGMARMHRRA